MTFTTGGRARVVGVVREVLTETIEGRGRAVGVGFRPGGLHPYLNGPVSSITDRFTPVEEIFGPETRAVTDAIIAEPGYADRAHSTRDFSRVIGVAPAQYARGCPSAASGTGVAPHIP
jgi:Domain of unknown function (DUF6597)